MNMKWDGRTRKYYMSPIPRVERMSLWQRFVNWIEPGFMWFVLAVLVGVMVWLFYLNIQLSRIHW
jgi:hypothetical protein